MLIDLKADFRIGVVVTAQEGGIAIFGQKVFQSQTEVLIISVLSDTKSVTADHESR
jgi:ligand-binding sensor protein